ncbi:hypothetical protein Plhal703r1_c13g0066701 [Plasmopara halstedii]
MDPREAHPRTSATERNTPRPPRATAFLVEDSDKVDYELDVSFQGWEEEKVRQQRDMRPAQTLWRPCLFCSLSTSWKRSTIFSRLDDA